MHSRSSMSPTYHLPELGYITTFQSPATQLRSIPNRNSQGKNFIKCSQSSFLLPNKISRNSEYLKNRNNKSLKKYCVPDTSQDGYASKSEDDNNLTSFRDALQKNLIALYRFSRPHTVIGTILGIISVSLLPVQTIADLTPTFFMGLLKALVPSVLMNIYVVGLNQLYDVEIDKVNKPDLPLASGDFSMETGATIVSISLLMSMTMGIRFKSPPLFLALFISFLLGSVYSIELPFLRWKRHAFLAASCILTVRAVVVQLAFFIHIQKYVLGRPLVITRSLMFATAFMCFFSAVIAVFKDIPDVDGDRHFGIQSFSVSQGQERVFWLCVYMLLFAYGAAVIVGASSCFMPSKLVTVLGHCTLASFLWLKTQSVDLSCKASITSFYMFIWKSLAIAIMLRSPPLVLGVIVWFLFGTAYSVQLPFLRWKGNSFLAAISIMFLNGLLQQFPYFIHIQKYVLGRPVEITRSLMFATAFICCFCIASAFLKDLHDVDGDKEFGIETLSVKLGKERVFWLCVYMLSIAYGAAVVVGASSSILLSKLLTIISHCILASSLWLRARTVDLSSNTSTFSFYMFIWKLYYVEYLLIPFVRC